MPAYLFKWRDGKWRVNLDEYYPPFLELLLEAKDLALSRGVAMYSLYGYRSWALQHQFRLASINGTGGRAAPAGLSFHNYGMADDSVSDADLETAGLQLTPEQWKPEAFKVWGECVEEVGLVWGASFHDHPHCEWPGVNIQTLRQIHKDCDGATEGQKLQACWQYVDTLPRPKRKTP